MKYTKSSPVQGGWAKASEITTGTLVKLVTETVPVEGEFGTQDVAKARFKGSDEPKNVRLNKTTLNGLIDAFGEDSKLWINQILTAHTEKALVAGKRVTILYLVPEGYELKENSEGFMGIIKKDGETRVEKDKVPYPDEEINPSDIPF